MGRHALILYGWTSLAAVLGWLGGPAQAAASEFCVRATSVDEPAAQTGWRRAASKLIPVVDFRLTGDSAGLAHRTQSGTDRRAIRLDALDNARNSTRHWELMVNWNPLRIFGLLGGQHEPVDVPAIVCASDDSLARHLLDPADAKDLDRDALADAIRQAHRRALRDALEAE